MKAYKNLYTLLCSYENLGLAFKKARKRKTTKPYVIEFEKDLKNNLLRLKSELENLAYSPRPLTTFIVRDPKTRKISAAAFRDRVVHHAICNIIGPIFESQFIYDSFANQKKKGTLAALNRFDYFLRKISWNGKSKNGRGERLLDKNAIIGYAFKADIRHYFDNIDHETLMGIIGRKIKDQKVLWLIRQILENHKTRIPKKGMPLGNLTSQFFANVYLHELDLFVKHHLKVKYYLRYVDDFVILHRNREVLENWNRQIESFLKERLELELHPLKSSIISLRKGLTLLGFRIFYHHKLLKRSNMRRALKRFEQLKIKHERKEITYGQVLCCLNGWLGYAKMADTYNFRNKILREWHTLPATK